MKPKDRKIRRIAAVQEQMHRLAQWELMECCAKEYELQERQRRIIEGFNEVGAMPERMARTASRSLRNVSMEQGVLAGEKENLTAHALTEGRKLKQMIRVVDTTTRDADRDQEKRLLEEITEVMAGRQSRSRNI